MPRFISSRQWQNVLQYWNTLALFMMTGWTETQRSVGGKYWSTWKYSQQQSKRYQAARCVRNEVVDEVEARRLVACGKCNFLCAWVWRLFAGRIAQSVEHSANNAAVQGSSRCMTSIGSSLAKQGSTLIGEHICEFIFKDFTYYEYLLRIFTKLCLTKHFVLNSDWQSK